MRGLRGFWHAREVSDGSGVHDRMGGVRLPGLRAHQAAALAAFEDHAGRWRYHFVMPPGAGKTLLGAQIAARVGRRVLVLAPNTAIASQWMTLWTSAGSVSVGDDRGLETDVTVLTYQAVATFDEEQDAGSPMARLHPNARDLIDRLHSGPAFTLILDEAHHLAQTWGELLVEVLRDAHAGRDDGPLVVALTATPRESLSQDEAALTAELFGPVLYSVSTPALVRDGVLAPYRELAWFVDPTPAEREYLQSAAIRWQELLAAVTAPGFAEIGFLEYIDAAWVAHAGVTWSYIEKNRSELARALVRGAHNGVCALPDGARIRDEHRQPMQVEDWVALLSDYGRTVLARDDPPAPGWERLRAGLRSVGWTLTRRGARRGQSSVDRVLARSAAKAVGAGYLVAQEYLIRGADLRAVVLTDFENVGATPPADVEAVLTQRAGSAWEALSEVQAANPGLRVVLMTGSSIGGARESLEQVLAPGLSVVDRTDGLCEIAGSWGPRQWVPHVTGLFQSGAVDVLVGTRGLLGEGWDAPAANVLVDLTAATTATAVVQIRGRAIRRDPARSDKVAHIWSVTTVDEQHPRGDLDYRRLVAKHRGYLAPDQAGRIVAGVEHLDTRCGPYAPPTASQRLGINADALSAAGRIDDSRRVWQIGTPYSDVTEAVVRVRPGRRPVALGVPEVQVRTWRGWPVTAAVVGGAGAAGVAAGQVPDPVVAGIALGAAALAWIGQAAAVRWRARWVARKTGADGMLLAFGRAVAQARSWDPEDVVVEPDPSGSWLVRLSNAAADQSRIFAQSVEEILSPIDFPRYIMSRRLGTGRAVMWHAVPDVFGVNKQTAEGFAANWRRHVSRGELLYTGSAEGAGVAEAVRGLDPMDLSTAMYSQWG